MVIGYRASLTYLNNYSPTKKATERRSAREELMQIAPSSLVSSLKFVQPQQV